MMEYFGTIVAFDTSVITNSKIPGHMRMVLMPRKNLNS